MISVQLVHAAHVPGITFAGSNTTSEHLHTDVAHSSHDHLASDTGTCALPPLESPPEHSQKISGSDHGHHDDLTHQIMECDCLVCKFVQLPALAPAWQTDCLVHTATRAPPAANITLSPARTSLRPPGRAPPLV